MAGKGIDDIGIRFGAQDVEWLLSSVDLMIATGKATGCSKETEARMIEVRDQIALQSALPPHSSSYGESFRYADAMRAVRACDAWEARLLCDWKSYSRECRLVIETHKAGKKSEFKLASNMRLGRDKDATPMQLYGVHLSRLVEICQSVAPANAIQIEERTIPVLVDYDRYLDRMGKGEEKPVIAAIILEGVVSEKTKGPFVVRDVKTSRKMEAEERGLPEHLRYVDVTVSTGTQSFGQLVDFVCAYNAEQVTSARIIPLRA